MPKRTSSPLICGLGLLLVLCAGQPNVPRTSGPLPCAAYVWQRAWNPPVTQAITEHARSFNALVFLGAEVSWKDGRLQVARIKPDYTALAAAQRPIGLALRIGPFRGPFTRSDATAAALSDLAATLVNESLAHSVPLAELQVDFDCASAQLAGYTLWLHAIRERLGSTPLVITTLPSWLHHRSFATLAASVDGFVLQVHSLARPQSPAAAFSLCDVAAARQAVERAARFARPFRVALPTYGYTVAFDRQQKFIGLSAEGPARDWPAGSILRETSADPGDMAALIREWTIHRPTPLAGVIWYRLPVRGDALNWSWPTLAAVMQGRAPQAVLRAHLQHPSDGLVEVTLVNQGDRGTSALPGVLLEWPGGPCLAGDGLNGFHLDTRRPGLACLTGANSRELKPGELRKVGWLRFDQREPSVRARIF